jgi:hypothetical protein
MTSIILSLKSNSADLSTAITHTSKSLKKTLNKIDAFSYQKFVLKSEITRVAAGVIIGLVVYILLVGCL